MAAAVRFCENHRCTSKMSTCQRAVMPCIWGVKSGMDPVWVAGITVPLVTHGPSIYEHFRDEGIIYKVLYKLGMLYLGNLNPETRIKVVQ